MCLCTGSIYCEVHIHKVFTFKVENYRTTITSTKAQSSEYVASQDDPETCSSDLQPQSNDVSIFSIVNIIS